MKTGPCPRLRLGATISLLALAANPAAAQTPNDDIVVTGSRIAKSEFTSPDPIQVIDPDTARMEGRVPLAPPPPTPPAARGARQITSALPHPFVAPRGPPRAKASPMCRRCPCAGWGPNAHWC